MNEINFTIMIVPTMGYQDIAKAFRDDFFVEVKKFRSENGRSAGAKNMKFFISPHGNGKMNGTR